jgi:hypothetical protein
MNSLYAFEWLLCAVWTLVWSSLSYIALAERHITLGAGKYGLGGGTYDGPAAVFVGLTALGTAIGGGAWLLRTNRFRRQLWALLFVVWLGFCAFWVFG